MNKNKMNCKLLGWCGHEHCVHNHSGDICSKCEYYVVVDSAIGECRAVPPQTVITFGFPKLIRYEKRPVIVGWCMKVCGIFKNKKED